LFVEIGGRKIGPGYPPFLVAEIGINHNGSLEDALNMIFYAKQSGADAVKFQKRTPRVCVPRDQWDKSRETPWGTRSYIDYKEDIEFGHYEYDAIAARAKELGIMWFASVWDEPSVEFMEQYDPPCYKIGSASLTDEMLQRKILLTGRPIILSTGMSTMAEILPAVFYSSADIICHSTSIYPCPKDQLNLRMIPVLAKQFPTRVVGYSGHEAGTEVTPAAVALGASYIERHFTLDRRGWGTDQAASIEHWQFHHMADQCHAIWVALGDGIKQVYPEEEAKKVSLKRNQGAPV
jgi:N-acetylneuraminate synthase